MKLRIFLLCTVTLITLVSLSCSPNEQLQEYEETLREYQNIIVHYQEQVNSLQAQLESERQLAAECQTDLENVLAEKEQMEATYQSNIDQLEQRIEDLQDRLDDLESYKSTYTATEVRALVRQHERAQEWLEGKNEISVSSIRWQSEYQGSGNWIVTMLIEGEVQCFVVFGFNEQSGQVDVIRDNCPQ